MEKVIKTALNNMKNIREIKIKIFSRTLNNKHNLILKNFFILKTQLFFSSKYSKEKLYLKENCITYKLSENINIYYSIEKSYENLLRIIKEKTKYEFNHIYPHYINLPDNIFNKMTNYITEKQKIEYNIYMTRKIMIQKGINKKKKSYFIQPINEVFDAINEIGMKSFSKKKSKKFWIKLTKKEENNKRGNIILLKPNNIYNKELIEKKENFLLIKQLNKNICIKNNNNKNKKIKAINIFINIFANFYEKNKIFFYQIFFYNMKLIYNNNINNTKRKKNFYLKTLIFNLNKNKIKKRFNRYSLMESNSITPKLFLDFDNKNFFEENKYKFKPVYLFNKKKTEFDKFFSDWNNNKDKKMINDIFKYSEKNFNINHHVLYSQINKLIKNNKLEKLQQEFNTNKNTNNKRLNTISNFNLKKNYKKYFDTKSELKNNKILFNLKYQL